jgi:hypothetical protein
MKPTHALQKLESLRTEFGPGRSAWKLAFLTVLERTRLPSARAVFALHEQLSFMRAHPDDEPLLKQIEKMLHAFATRPDLRQHRAALADSGIAGTDIHYAFYWPTAHWLATRWPDQLHIDWKSIADPAPLAAALPRLASPLQAEWLRNESPSPRTALARMNAAEGYTGSGAFLVQRIAALPGNDHTREALADGLEIPYHVAPVTSTPIGTAADTPSRTLGWHAASPVSFISQPLQHVHPDLRAEMRKAPKGVRLASAMEARQLLDLARGALVTRSRDIDGIAYGDERDIWVVDDRDGLQWAVIGVLPERRAPLRATYGFLTLRNGVPTGYGQLDSLFKSVALSFNSYPTFRGAETARVFARLLAACCAFLGTTAFTLAPYQIGHRNADAVASGAWWFYYKLGFRPRNPALLALAEKELARMHRKKGYRSPPATLRQLATDTLVLDTATTRAPDWSRLASLGEVLSSTPLTRDASRQLLRTLGLRTAPGKNADQRHAWQAWAPLVQLLGVENWSATERKALVEVILAKGGRSERDYLQRFDAHPKLARALRAFAGA